MYRPLSPHVLIYKPQWSSILSVFNRVTGILVTLFVVFLIFSLKFITYHITLYPIYLMACSLSTHLAWLWPVAIAILAFSFFYHLSNGIRHLIWDWTESRTYWLDPKKMEVSAWLVLCTALLGAISFLCCLG